MIRGSVRKHIKVIYLPALFNSLYFCPFDMLWLNKELHFHFILKVDQEDQERENQVFFMLQWKNLTVPIQRDT